MGASVSEASGVAAREGKGVGGHGSSLNLILNGYTTCIEAQLAFRVLRAGPNRRKRSEVIGKPPVETGRRSNTRRIEAGYLGKLSGEEIVAETLGQASYSCKLLLQMLMLLVVPLRGQVPEQTGL